MPTTSDDVEHGRATDLPRLTSLRAFAALAVFGYHCGTVLGYGPAQHYIGIGYAGVAFFFILSGFVLTWSTPADRSARDFWQRRVARVYPLHLLTAVVALVLFGVPSLLVVVSNLLLVQAWFPNPSVHFGLNGVSWSLSCEAFFYGACPLFLFLARPRSLRHLAQVVGVWLMISFTVTMAFRLHDGVSGTLASTATLTEPLLRASQFALGIVLAVALQRGRAFRIPISVAVVFFAVSLQAVRMFMSAYYPATEYALVPAFVVLIWAAASADLQSRPAWVLRRPWLIYAGKASFAFYLVHHMVLLKIGVTGAAGVLLSLALSSAIAVLLHHAVEQPAERRLRPRRSGHAPAALSS